jgi:hypothetical protein
VLNGQKIISRGQIETLFTSALTIQVLRFKSAGTDYAHFVRREKLLKPETSSMGHAHP